LEINAEIVYEGNKLALADQLVSDEKTRITTMSPFASGLYLKNEMSDTTKDTWVI